MKLISFSHLCRVVAALVLFSGVSLTYAACPEPRFTNPKQIQIKGESALIVTHASSAFDPRYATKAGLDAIIQFAKERKIPVVYLVDDSPIKTYFFEDCAPDYWVKSIDGDVEFSVDVNHIYLAGGHAELCLSRSIHDLLYQAAKRTKRSLNITYVMDAIYSNGKTIHETDPFYRDFTEFMGVVTYGRPGGERWPKLTLLEATGIIKRPDWDYLYLQELLPRWDRTFDNDYRVELQMDDLSPVVLRRGNGFTAPTIKFHFVDSADLIR